MQKILFGIIDLTEAKRLRSVFEDLGIRLELKNNPETCASGGGCAPTVEVHVEAGDAVKIQEFLRDEKHRLLDGLNVNHALADEVFDPERETAVCPACGTGFSTKLSECPECGLGFSAQS